MTENDMITTTRVNLSGEPNRVARNPNIRGTPEWHAWEAGYSAARRDAGRALAGRFTGLRRTLARTTRKGCADDQI